jgi:hypothetical protein
VPIDLTKIDQRLLEAVRTGALVPFVGSGVSRHAVTGDSKAFPTWKDLLKELQDLAEQKEFISHDERGQIDELIGQGKFLMAAQALRSAMPLDLLERVFDERFSPKDARPGPLHRALFRLQAPLIITTNYDFLLEDAYAEEYRKSAKPLTYKDAAAVQALLQRHQQWHDRPSIFKIHGSAHAPGEAILSELDYRQLLYREPGYRMVLSAVFVMKVVLMIGFSFDDPEIRLVLESIRESLKYSSGPDYIVLPKNARNGIERKRWRQDFGIETIEYDPSPGHPELIELVDYLSKHLPVGINDSSAPPS